MIYSKIHQKPNSSVLTDDYGRVMRKLRVALTDVCNMRCFYCMPKNPQFLKHSQLLSPDELVNICSELTRLGVEQIRITGGEPTLRKEFREIITKISYLPVEQLAMTTNGAFLEPHLKHLKDHHIDHLNISLDSLDPGKFYKMTGSMEFDTIFKNILIAQEMGFHVKINTVIFRGMNHHEIHDFVRFSKKYGIEVRFLECMKIGEMVHQHQKHFISAEEMIRQIKSEFTLNPVQVSHDSTSFVFESGAGRIGFIASESKPFCDSCSRLRLSATGNLRSCLMSTHAVSLKNKSPELLPQIISELIRTKPISRIDHVNQSMFQIGG